MTKWYKIIVEFELSSEMAIIYLRSTVYMHYSYTCVYMHMEGGCQDFCKPKEGGADHGRDVCAREQTIVSQATTLAVRVWLV